MWAPNGLRADGDVTDHRLVPTRSRRRRTVARAVTELRRSAVIDALGWDPDSEPQRESVEVPLTPGHVQQLHRRRCDLLDTNLDLLTDIGTDQETNAIVMS